MRTRVAGLFLFLPLLAGVQFDQLVSRAGYPGSERIPATSALLSLLALKLKDLERRSHINDFNFDEAVGLFAGLNIPPKKSYATEYSYRTVRTHQQQLLSAWVGALAPLLFPQAKGFALDFHPTKLNQRGIWFITIRRRGAAILRRLQALPANQWHHAVLDTAQRRHQRIRYLDETVRLSGYLGGMRQVAVTGLGRTQPTLFLSNNTKESTRSLIMRYTGRNRVEDALGISVKRIGRSTRFCNWYCCVGRAGR